jgi:hypothetical protein
MTTNTPAPAHEAEQILDAIRSAGYRDHPTNIERKRVDAIISAVTPLLYELRAPVASAEVMDALNWVDDFIARCNRDDRGSCESVNVLRRALASAPIAGEAVYTLRVRGAIQAWTPTTAAFSIPDGEHQLFLRPAAPPAGETPCSCTSGDGSLRWPCAKHRTHSENDQLDQCKRTGDGA